MNALSSPAHGDPTSPAEHVAEPLVENRALYTVARNRIDGNLQCKTNTPRPVGGRNVVQGNKEDQCARL